MATAFPHTLTITHESDSLLKGKFSPALLEVLKSDPNGFRDNGYQETDADRELAAAA